MKIDRVPAALGVVGFAMVVFSAFSTFQAHRLQKPNWASLGASSMDLGFGKKNARVESRSQFEASAVQPVRANPVGSVQEIDYLSRARDALAQVSEWARDSDKDDELELDRLIEQYAEFETMGLLARAERESHDPSLWTETVKSTGSEIFVRKSDSESTGYTSAFGLTLFFSKTKAYDLSTMFKEGSGSTLVKFNDGSVLYTSTGPAGVYWAFDFADGRKVYRFLNPDGTPKYPRR